MNENKNKRIVYLILAIAAGLILNEVAPTSYLKSQYRKTQFNSNSINSPYSLEFSHTNNFAKFNQSVVKNVFTNYAHYSVPESLVQSTLGTANKKEKAAPRKMLDKIKHLVKLAQESVGKKTRKYTM